MKIFLKSCAIIYLLSMTGLTIQLLHKINFPWEIITMIGLSGLIMSIIIAFIN